jgi:putative hydroxymethylpyrimidine transport system substrate-binding protein
MKLKSLFLAAMLVIPMGQASAADKITVLLDWFVNPDHATLIVAQEKGYFKKHGLEVELIAPADPSDPPKLVAAGKADLAISYQPQLHLQVSEGLPLTRVGTLVATPLNSLVVLKDGPIKSLADLKGKKIGYSVSGVEDAMLKAMLEPNGVDLSDIELINVNFSLSPSLLSGQVDAVIGAFRNFELNQMDIEGYPGRAFYPEEEGVPAYDELIVIANNSKISDPRYKTFMLALEDAVQYLVNHPDDSWKLFIKKHKELDDELNKRAWADTIPRFALRPAALDVGRYDRFAKFMLDQGLIKKTPPVKDYAVTLD